MRIEHNFALNVTKIVSEELLKYGINIEIGFSSFKVDENNKYWVEISAIAKKNNAIDTVKTIYSAAELKEADYLRLLPTWQYGYPMPTEDNQYLQETYNLDKYCEICGCGLVQSSPFKLLGEPKWGKKQVLQMYWICDEFFVHTTLWENLFMNLGIEAIPVVNYKTGKSLETLVQLQIPNIDSEINLVSHKYTICSSCGRKKFIPHTRGLFPYPLNETELNIFKPCNYFGSGNSAHKIILVSSQLYKELSSLNVKGISFAACDKIK